MPSAGSIRHHRSTKPTLKERGSAGCSVNALGDDDGFQSSVPDWPKGSRNLQATNHSPHPYPREGDTVTSDPPIGLCSAYIRETGLRGCVLIGQTRACPRRVSTAVGRLSSLWHSARELLELLSPINFVFHSVLHFHFQRIKRFIYLSDCAQVDLVPTSPQFAFSS